MIIDNHTHLGVDPLFYLRGWWPYALDLERLRIEGRGVDRWVVFPFVSYMAMDIGALREGEIALGGEVPYAFENRRLANDILRLPEAERGLFLQFLMADPGRRQAAQVEDWRRLLAEGRRFFGIKIQATVIRSHILDLLDAGTPMLDFAEEHDLPFLIHSSIAPGDEWSQCADILRVAASRPRVRFVLAHSCRFHKPSLDRVAEMPNTWFDCSAHVIHCECAVRGLPAVAVPAERFPTDYTSPEIVLRDLAAAYPSKLIWGSDAPFYSYADDRLELRSTYARELEVLRALDPQARESVSFLNTTAWLGLSREQFFEKP
ncbi:MAG: amidohydrolase family protein [Terrimicrobiaceae bacterium]|nr:amidohydrolase family protein [Terrimicrobiaceae bacterium]